MQVQEEIKTYSGIPNDGRSVIFIAEVGTGIHESFPQQQEQYSVDSSTSEARCQPLDWPEVYESDDGDMDDGENITMLSTWDDIIEFHRWADEIEDDTLSHEHYRNKKKQKLVQLRQNLKSMKDN